MTRAVSVAAFMCLAGVSLAWTWAEAQDRGGVRADVAVIVDTSKSMREAGMDPERTSLLVSKLLADVVPGYLAVIRLLDVREDRQLIPSQGTGQMIPCTENPNNRCEVVAPGSDWTADARRRKFGALERPARGDAAYKGQLDTHLEQRINNSMFGLAFSAAEGVFDGHASAPAPRSIVWLSDGRSDGAEVLVDHIGRVRSSGVHVEALVFGSGDLTLPRSAGLNPKRVSTPAELMKAFAGVFRRIVQAPYEVDNVIASGPTFEMKPLIDEAWVVVYGDDTLSEATVVGPTGAQRADFAQDRHAGAGAYRVAHFVRPPAGVWEVKAVGGGTGVAYAVVQRSGLSPAILGPATALVGVDSLLEAELRTSDGRALTHADLPPGLHLSADIEGETMRLVDDGSGGDRTANDGRFSAIKRFAQPGDVKLVVRARSDVLDRTTEAVVNVSGFFEYTGGPVHIDFGRLTHHSEACRPLPVSARHQGSIPFSAVLTKPLPAAHVLEVRGAGGVLRPGGAALAVGPGEPLTICLVVDDAATSLASGEPWLRLGPSTRGEPPILVHLKWDVVGMTFWERWGRLILLLLLLLVLLFIVYGWIKPRRFARTLALVFVPDRADLDDQSPQPLKQWRGVGIGWYRDARAYLHPSFRVSGKAQGALAGLRAAPGGTRVRAESGNALYRETIDGEWEIVAEEGRYIRPGEPHRVGETGPYFVTSVRGAR